MGDPLPGTGTPSSFNYPAFTIETRSIQAVRVIWVNQLVDEPTNALYMTGDSCYKAAEIALAGHANSARDEMQQLADEFALLAKQTSVPTSAIEQPHAYLDPTVTPVALGRADIPMNFRGPIVAAELLVGMLTTIRLLRLRRTLKKWQKRKLIHVTSP